MKKTVLLGAAAIAMGLSASAMADMHGIVLLNKSGVKINVTCNNKAGVPLLSIPVPLSYKVIGSDMFGSTHLQCSLTSATSNNELANAVIDIDSDYQNAKIDSAAVNAGAGVDVQINDATVTPSKPLPGTTADLPKFAVTITKDQ